MDFPTATTQWICGFKSGKKNFPAPWHSAEWFPNSKKVFSKKLNAEVTFGASIVKAIYAILDGSAYFSICSDGSLIAEMSKASSPSGERKIGMIKSDGLEGNLTLYSAVVEAAGDFRPLSEALDSGDILALLLILWQTLEEGDKARWDITSHSRPKSYKGPNPKEALCDLRGEETRHGIIGTPASSWEERWREDFCVIEAATYQFLKDGAVSAVEGEENGIGFLTPSLASTLAKSRDSTKGMLTFGGYASHKLAVSEVFRTDFSAKFKTPEEPIEHREETIEDLKARLKLPIHELTEKEQRMVETIGDNYVISENLVKIAELIRADWKVPGVDLAPNYILEGDSGSGKTAATKFFSCVLGIPRTKMTMSPTMESANLIGAFYPVFDETDTWGLSERDEKAVQMVQEAMMEDPDMGQPFAGETKGTEVLKKMRHALTTAGVREAIRLAYNIPTDEEIEFEPLTAAKALGHDVAEDVLESELRHEANQAENDAAFRLLQIFTEKAEEGASVSYRFIYSELMKAFENGWLVEVQEAASILRPGVLTELNSLLEPNGRIELPNGKFLYRHPDTIVVFTTNRGYAGNMDLNESLRDRCLLGEKMDTPPVDVMAKRAMAQTGITDMKLALRAAKAVDAVCKLAKERNIKGSFGMRSLIAWMMDLKRGDLSAETFRRRVIYKMTTVDDDVSDLMDEFELNFLTYESRADAKSTRRVKL